MARDLVLQLRYVGVFPQNGHREYRFNIERNDARVRHVVMTIENGLFAPQGLMFQEAPDLCYQKLLLDMQNESEDSPIRSRVTVTPDDIDMYRDSHPRAKMRKLGSRRQS